MPLVDAADGRRDALVIAHQGEVRRCANLWFLGAASRPALRFDDAIDRVEQLLLDLLGPESQIHGQAGFVGDDVGFGASVQHPDGHDGWLGRFELTRHDGLQTEHDKRGDDNRVDADLRARSMAASPRMVMSTLRAPEAKSPAA